MDLELFAIHCAFPIAAVAQTRSGHDPSIARWAHDFQCNPASGRWCSLLSLLSL